jgi:hypothetical protein
VCENVNSANLYGPEKHTIEDEIKQAINNVNNISNDMTSKRKELSVRKVTTSWKLYLLCICLI